MLVETKNVLAFPTLYVVCHECKEINSVENEECIHCESFLENERKLSIYKSKLNELTTRMFEGLTYLKV